MHKVLHSLITKSNQGTSKPHGTVLYQPRGPGIEWERHNLILLPSWLVILPCRFYTGGSDGKESAYNAGDLLGFNPWVRKIPWRKEWQPIPVFLPGKFQGQRNLVGYSPWVCKESDMTEWLTPQPLNIETHIYSKLGTQFHGFTRTPMISGISG